MKNTDSAFSFLHSPMWNMPSWEGNLCREEEIHSEVEKHLGNSVQNPVMP
jgi:hypothetical protein